MFAALSEVDKNAALGPNVANCIRAYIVMLETYVDRLQKQQDAWLALYGTRKMTSLAEGIAP